MGRIRSADELLLEHIRASCVSAGVDPDKYDPDFIYGVILMWLADKDAVLTPNGVRRGSDWRRGELE